MGDAKLRRAGFIESCGSCRFFSRLGPGNPVGNCRARAPQVVMTGQIQNKITGEVVPMVQTYWPQVPDAAWCGDFTKRPYQDVDLATLSQEAMEGTG